MLQCLKSSRLVALRIVGALWLPAPLNMDCVVCSCWEFRIHLGVKWLQLSDFLCRLRVDLTASCLFDPCASMRFAASSCPSATAKLVQKRHKLGEECQACMAQNGCIVEG
eukprot:CCRYP_008016-RA/>CCRYP_008016-RA protein AED:0.39 eAED:0.42 QI:626/0.5/0.66/1/0/0/3/0/109